jgi:hypothetical protein
VEEDLRNSKDLAGEVRLAGVAVISRFRAVDGSGALRPSSVAIDEVVEDM